MARGPKFDYKYPSKKVRAECPHCHAVRFVVRSKAAPLNDNIFICRPCSFRKHFNRLGCKKHLYRAIKVTVTCPACHMTRIRNWGVDLPCPRTVSECEKMCHTCAGKALSQRQEWLDSHRGPMNLTSEQRAKKSANARRQVLAQGGVPNAVKFTRGSTAGEHNNRWNGGITAENVKIRTSEEGKAWSRSVMKRDDFTCQICFKRGGKLHAHHVHKFSEFPELRFSIDNGLTACVDCHREIIHRGNPHGPSMSIEEINWFKTAPVSIDWRKVA